MCVSLVGARHRLRRLHSNVSPGAWRAVLALTVLALVVRAFAPAVPPPWMVGWTNIEMGRGILLDHRPGYCLDGGFGSCRKNFPFYPAGYPFFLAVAFSLVGTSESVALGISVAASVLSVPLAFLFAHVLLRREGVAVIVALLMAMTPLVVAYSLMVRNEVPSMAVELLALWACCAWSRRGGRWTALLWTASTALYFQMRPEAPFLILVMGALAFGRLRRSPPVLALIVGSLLLIPYLVAFPEHITVYEFNRTWYPDGRGLLRHFSPRFALLNNEYISMWINAWYMPLLLPALALLALASSHDRRTLLIGLWFTGRLFIYLVHSYPYDPRYTINVVVPFVLLTSLGARRLATELAPKRRWLVPCLLVLSLFAYLPLAYAPGFGQEGIADGHMTVLRTVHVVLIPLALAGLAFLSSNRQISVLALLVLVFAAAILPRFGAAGIRTVGVNAQIRKLISFEGEVAQLMSDRIGECTVVTERPFAVTYLWDAPVLYLQWAESVKPRVMAGECMYYYETRACADERCRLIIDDTDLVLEPVLGDLEAPRGLADWLVDITVYRIRPSV